MDGSDMIRVLLVGDSPQSFSLITQRSRSVWLRMPYRRFFGGREESAAVVGIRRSSEHTRNSELSHPGSDRLAVRLQRQPLLFSPRGRRFLVVACSASRKECYGPALTVGELSRVLDDLSETNPFLER